MNVIVLRSSWVPQIFKGAPSCGLRAHHTYSVWGPHLIAPKGNLA